MVKLRSDCLLIDVGHGKHVACDAMEVVRNLLVGQISERDLNTLANTVVTYFREEVGRTRVTMDEFRSAIKCTLTEMDFIVEKDDDEEDFTMEEAMDAIAGALCNPANN